MLGKRIGRLAVGLVVVAAVLGAGWVYAAKWAPARRKYPIQGVELSAAQGNVDWTMLGAEGADFAYVRATDGAATRDAAFEANWAGAATASLRRGAVHRWSFCSDGAAQADNFVTTVPRDAGALPAMVELSFDPSCDARPEPAQLIAQLKRFLAVAETHTGEPMLIKISRAVERRYHVSAAIRRPLWEVGDFFPPDYGTRPWRMWQASDMRRLDAVDGPVAWDVVTP